MVQRINDAFRRMHDAITGNAAELAEDRFKALLLDATLSEDYSEVATYLACFFWDAVAAGIAAPLDTLSLHTALLERFPALREPLERALEEENPYRAEYLLPHLVSPGVEPKAAFPFPGKPSGNADGGEG